MSFRIFKLNPDIPDVVPAGRDLEGAIPARALRHCEPFLVANSAGFVINSPVDVDITWTGTEILAFFEDIGETILVDRLYLPGSAERWASEMPESVANVLPPFIEAFPEHGIAQVWTGLFVTTPPGVSAWVRSPINREIGSAVRIIEGVIDTDWWTGPLFTVFQFLKTDFPVRLKRSRPILQVVPVARSLLSTGPGAIEERSIADADDTFLTELLSTAHRRNTEPPGSYRRAARATTQRRAGQ
jgi:hypothetical protein